MLKHLCALFITALFISASTAQAEGEKVKLKGTTCHGTFQKFRCGKGIGQVTIDEIYEKGWRVIAVVESEHFVNLVIEKQEG